MKTASIRQTVTLHATPQEVYDLLMNAKKHGAFTGSKVTMSHKVGGTFNVFDGYVHGYNIELVANKKIVQAWHFKEDGWPDDHYSICTFEFIKDEKQTTLKFCQVEVPEQNYESLKSGWKEYYWQPMKKLLKSLRTKSSKK